VDFFIPERPEGDSLGMLLWLVLPMLAVVLIILFQKISWTELGFIPNFKGNGKWYVASFLIFPIVTGIVLLVGVAAKWIDASALNPRSFILVFAGSLLVNFIKNIFEETVWRGYLTSQLIKVKLADWKIYLIMGLVWGVWHVPYYLVFLPAADIQLVLPVSRGVFAAVAVVTMVAWSVMFVELYRVTKSIWPAVILHMVEDSLVNPLVIAGYISIVPGKELLVSPITGVFTSVLYLAIGLGIRAYRTRPPRLSKLHGWKG
jgi:membrane protease YdiL (CAAX protease family)